MKSRNLLGGHSCGKESGRQKIDRIPDTSGFEQTVETGEDGHGYASRQAALHASRYRIGFKWKPCAHLFWGHRKALDEVALRSDDQILSNDRHNFFVLVREDFPEPANAARDRKHRAEDPAVPVQQLLREIGKVGWAAASDSVPVHKPVDAGHNIAV